MKLFTAFVFSLLANFAIANDSDLPQSAVAEDTIDVRDLPLSVANSVWSNDTITIKFETKGYSLEMIQPDGFTIDDYADTHHVKVVDNVLTTQSSYFDRNAVKSSFEIHDDHITYTRTETDGQSFITGVELTKQEPITEQ